jgi:hypothetical protein
MVLPPGVTVAALAVLPAAATSKTDNPNRTASDLIL